MAPAGDVPLHVASVPAQGGPAPVDGGWEPAPLDGDRHEAARLAAVRRVTAALGDSRALDRLTRLAALLLHVPYAQVSLVGDAHVVASVYGTPPQRPAPGEQPRTAGTDRVADPAAQLAAPLVDSARQRLGVLSVHVDEPRHWSPEDVAVLTELAESVVAELELRALTVEAGSSATRLGLALEAADIGSFSLDAVSGELLWDERLIRLFGYEPASFVQHLDSFTARVHPEDVERVTESVEHALRSSGELTMEYRIVPPGGQVRWVEARGRVLRQPGGRERLLGIAYDSTALREARDRLSRVLETMTDAFYSLDRDWRFTYVNRQAERLLRRRRDELLGSSLWEHPEFAGSVFEENYRYAAEHGVPVVFEAALQDPLDGFEVKAWPGPDGVSVYFQQITHRRRFELEREQAYAEREQAVLERERAYAEAEAANRRLSLLAEASTRLSASLEPRQVLERLSAIVLPAHGEWVVVGLVADTAASLLGEELPDPARVHAVHVAHADPARQAALRASVEAVPLSTTDAVGIGAVARTGRASWTPAMRDTAVEKPVGEPVADRDVQQQVAPGAAGGLTLPLVNRGRLLGALTVAEPSGGAADRALLADLAARAAVALDNALLYGAERRTGITLQRSLLPREVPEVPGLLTAGRYLPGATGAFVGGDWYQGVAVGDGLVLAMGDVMGHGMRSAARMGQLRAIVATLALEGHGPAQLLTRLAAHVDVLLDLELATLLLAAYDPACATLTVASAGHPPPLLAPLHGEPAFVDVRPGPPLGSFAMTYEQVVVPLEPDTTLVLYTDGLVENRAESLDLGLERLRVALRDVRLPPEQVADHVLRVMDRGSGGDDDVALLVLSHLRP